jgi:hypothetical protein
VIEARVLKRSGKKVYDVRLKTATAESTPEPSRPKGKRSASRPMNALERDEAAESTLVPPKLLCRLWPQRGWPQIRPSDPGVSTETTRLLRLR